MQTAQPVPASVIGDPPPPRSTSSWPLIPLLALGAFVGLVAALGMTLVLLVLRDVLGFATPSELIGDRLTAFISIEEFFHLLDQFGGYEGLKQAGGSGIIAGQIVAGVLAGVVFAVLTAKRGVRPWVAAGGIVAVFYLPSVGLLWPNLDTNYLGLPPEAARLITGLGLLIGYGTYGGILLVAFRLLSAPRDLAHEGGPSTGRRVLLVGGVGVAVAAGSVGLLRQLYDRATFSYDGLGGWVTNAQHPYMLCVHPRPKPKMLYADRPVTHPPREPRRQPPAHHAQRPVLYRHQEHRRSEPHHSRLVPGDQRPGE